MDKFGRRLFLGGAGALTAAAAALALFVAGAALPSTETSARAASLTSAPFGKTQEGAPVTRYTMTSRSGMRVSFINYGGIITDVSTPDRQGRPASVTLGSARRPREDRRGGADRHFASDGDATAHARARRVSSKLSVQGPDPVRDRDLLRRGDQPASANARQEGFDAVPGPHQRQVNTKDNLP